MTKLLIKLLEWKIGFLQNRIEKIDKILMKCYGALDRLEK